MNQAQPVGRPRRSSKRTLEEAAAELFLEQTYAGTTVDQIAQRAGVSRNTFFNYFGSKSDVLWVDVDETLERLADELALAPTDVPAMDAVRDAVIRVAAAHPDGRVPWALTQVDLMGTRDDLEASGLRRLMKQSEVLRDFLSRRLGDGAGDLLPQAVAFAVLAAAAAAAGVWASAGVSRRPLADYVAEAVGPTCAGFAAAI
ncbi:TetR/AcrR family transcriptional regulator [Mycetocola zhadangensis]|uniref:TetR family transcriptional regulator n=1 Tax=Mycetocola zhadangensis TaxID=1164595 RepID=A0A3L7J5E5_9MICO|nr:TetR/AcrR family transcriptional regulator [Mycetocola zhadangensis]RLQ85938.1 TetR family transcriptional regulator [Mycetocola zhadangensis]GGE87086.1 TetR family transcriptional regulator [Mycetocola zhadangensis]